MNLKFNKNENLSNLAYQDLKTMVLSGVLPADQPIVERLVSQKIGISRTPIREALGRLEHEGLVRIIPRRGAFPVTLGLREYLNILTIREVLEGLAIRLAVDHVSNAKISELKEVFEKFHDVDKTSLISHQEYALANVRFHREILKLSHNPKLIETIQGLYDHLSLVPWRNIEITERRVRSIGEHKLILKALEIRDSDMAERVARAHIQSLRDDVERVARISPELFKVGKQPDEK
jgi:DNA-binding GntR family transcriptional regulator